MRVLFISSGNQKKIISPTILNQGKSLIDLGISVDYYQILGKGIFGYLNNIPRLRKYLKEKKYDIIHAHYALVGIVASLAGAKTIVVSLMGSDVYQYRWLRFLTILFCRFVWKVTIVKSERMNELRPKIRGVVIPNGVDLKRFRLFSSREIQIKFPNKKLPWVLFIGHPTLKEKNRKLADQAVKLIQEPAHEYIHLHGIDHDVLPYYMNAASVLVMTSLWEGSPNVIKEAMACNLPIVSVNVGDVEGVIGETKGCYITSYDGKEIAEKIKEVLFEEKRTNGRENMKHLSSIIIANRILKLYQSILRKSF